MKQNDLREENAFQQLQNTPSEEGFKTANDGELQNRKSQSMFPPLKKTKNEEKDRSLQKLNDLGPPPSLNRRTTQQEDRKCMTQSNNTCVVRKFNSKKRIQKKKIITVQFKPEILAKYNNFMDMLSYVNISNNLKIENKQLERQYVLYVGKGNNGSLLKNIFKNYRPWWTIQENDPANQKINLHWYQLRQNQILQNFKQVLKTDVQFQSCDYYLEEGQIKIQKPIQIKGHNRAQSIRSHSMIKDHNMFTKISFNKKNSSKSKISGKSTENHQKISPFGKKQTVKQLKEEGLQAQSQIIPVLKKPLINPRMWPIYSNYRRIFCATDMKKLKSFGIIHEDGKIHGKFSRNKMKYIQERSKNITMHNHLENNWNLSNKKALFVNMKNYFKAKNINPFDYIPMTFHVQKIGDKEYDSFLEEYYRRAEMISQDQKMTKKGNYKGIRPKKRNAWLIKPGQNTNRGIGIQVVESIEQIKQVIEKEETDSLGRPRTHIIQEYIMPFLYHKRKFDIRSYILVTSINGFQKGYWYQDGYIRTASKEFNMKNLANRMIHLTNDAVQKKSEDYGKYEPGNKLSFSDFQRYLDTSHQGDHGMKLKFWQQAYPQMKKLAGEAIRAVYTKMNPNKKDYCFEVFGLDFLIDDNFKVWLIQANTNPCLEVSAPLLGRLIPSLLQNVFRMVVDPIFPPPSLEQLGKLSKKIILPDSPLQNNKFELIFDEMEEGKELRALLKGAPQLQIYNIEEEQDEYEEQFQKQNCI